MEQKQTYILEMKGITKRFPGVKALSNVDLNIKPGTVHALMGENGAGKSTLMKILIGMYSEYEGEIVFCGKNVKFNDIKQALDMGISMIHQELTYVENMTIAENIFLGKEPALKKVWVNEKSMLDKTKELLNRIGLNLNPKTLMKDLSVSEKQMVEIAKAISYNSKIIIMDEPTSAISDREVDLLFSIIQDLKKDNVAIIYISHKMDEIFKISDQLTILRDGTFIGTYDTEELTIDVLVSLMVGRQLTDLFPKREKAIGENILSVSGLKKESVYSNISFHVRKGEILGIAGLMGAGRTEVVNSIFGLEPYDEGEIKIHGEKVQIKSPSDAINLGIGLVSEDRKHVGLVLPLSVRENMTLTNLHLISNYSVVSKVKEKRVVDKMIQSLSIKTPHSEQLVKNLSGGNQQKIVIAKSLLRDPDVLILDEPTRGIDVGAKSEIYHLITKLADEGKAIIMVSSELPEILGLSDRILVLHEGRITGELTKEEANQEIIMKYAVGG
ncbi:sugar ABC transporter ATP-binding protein [Metabacillus litoralis]|uniref:sugar ABC transporter ATP-binding protein n=1 Tax=Metabacillus litoralis TaxID=152268 RepID=UPI00203CF23C|nr:sugar ABC transporter ATP-binding protein [Metabacillus litoralis]MCM3409590.1 sugar ABC transporter ATP-binding protein [Metabacillus litoralis]